MTTGAAELPPTGVGRGVVYALRSGLLLATGLLLLSFLVLALTGGDHLGFSTPSSLASVRATGALGEALLFGGILVLVLTPVLRVGLSVVLFASGRDWRFTVITLFVFLVLVATAVSGLYL